MYFLDKLVLAFLKKILEFSWMDFHLIMMASNANHSQMDSILKKNMKSQIGKLGKCELFNLAKWGCQNSQIWKWQFGLCNLAKWSLTN
jgi:hypothetical protein